MQYEIDAQQSALDIEITPLLLSPIYFKTPQQLYFDRSWFRTPTRRGAGNRAQRFRTISSVVVIGRAV